MQNLKELLSEKFETVLKLGWSSKLKELDDEMTDKYFLLGDDQANFRRAYLKKISILTTIKEEVARLTHLVLDAKKKVEERGYSPLLTGEKLDAIVERLSDISLLKKGQISGGVNLGVGVFLTDMGKIEPLTDSLVDELEDLAN